MLPLIARASQEVLLLVPGALREAADALGVGSLADGARRDPPERRRRDRDRSDPRDRTRGRRDSAAARSPTASSRTQRDSIRHLRPWRADHPDVHLSGARASAGHRHSPARVGRGVRAARVHPAGEHRRAGAARAQPTRRGWDGSSGGRSEQRRPEAGCESTTGLPRPHAGHRPRRRSNGRASQVARPVVFDIRDMSVTYGDEAGARLDDAQDLPQRRHGRDRAVGLRQVDVPPQPQPDERLDPGLSGSTARSSTTATTCTGAGVNRVEVRRRIGMVFQKPNPFPKSIYDNVAWAPRNLGMKDEHRRARRAGAAQRGAVGRGQGPPARQRAQPLRRPAAAPVHRARDRDRARRAAARRAGLGARPDRDRRDRGADARRSRTATRS